MFGAIAEYEKTMIVLKLRGARAGEKTKAGRCEGASPMANWQLPSSNACGLCGAMGLDLTTLLKS
jgi:hypothetical protein